MAAATSAIGPSVNGPATSEEKTASALGIPEAFYFTARLVFRWSE